MSNKILECAGCRKPIEGFTLKCCECSKSYDLDCANVTENCFISFLTEECKATWKCVLCVSQRPKRDNTNTPVRGAAHSVNPHRGAALMSLSPEEMMVHNTTAHNDTIEMSDTQMLVMEVRLFKEEMRATRLQMAALTQTMSGLAQKINECDLRINQIDSRVGNLEARVSEEPMPVNSGPLLETIEQLKAEINDRDQDQLSNDIEITSIPEEKGENLVHIVNILSTKLGVALTEHDLVSAMRVGRTPDSSVAASPAPRPRPIVVRLARRASRDQLISAARVRRGITTEDTGLPAPHRRFYVNERLTKLNRQLFWQAREAGNRLGWRFVWSREGKIYARRQQGIDSPRHRIRTEADLRRVFGSDAVGTTSTQFPHSH